MNQNKTERIYTNFLWKKKKTDWQGFIRVFWKWAPGSRLGKVNKVGKIGNFQMFIYFFYSSQHGIEKKHPHSWEGYVFILHHTVKFFNHFHIYIKFHSNFTFPDHGHDNRNFLFHIGFQLGFFMANREETDIFTIGNWANNQQLRVPW